ncbi:hypothetical protein Sango_2715700 [Sesamum angolense]|uniref:RNase H type-1 domain-containing protein n=1 Tax=Sesamum angolense TaxID=2727404 RepID=A0AAE1W372_9LAMI|nr:hypothetical protein Sango_2715700 [Sesamum angolense]
MTKWAVELSEHGIKFELRSNIKAQALADFISEVTENEDSTRSQYWEIFVDGSSTSSRSGVGIVIKSLEADYMEYVITLEFPASNNEAEYEAILLRSRLIHAAEARKVRACSNSHKAHGKLRGAKERKIEGVFVGENLTPTWTTLIVQFLRERILLEDHKVAKKVKLRAEYVLLEIQEESCGNHSGARSLARKVLRQGYYWPMMLKDASALETPFNLVYGTEVVLPAEIGEETWKVRSYDSTINSESRREDLDLMEEKREMAERGICIYKSKMARAYDDRVRPPSSRKEI